MIDLIAFAALTLCAPPATSETSDVVSYPPAFFADAAPTSALDMVRRLPAFTFDKGATRRGLEGASGNVLIDGKVPVAKNDTLEEILQRIPAAAVARIDVVRSRGAGVDMRGYTVVANVVQKSNSGFRGAIAASESWLRDGDTEAAFRAEGQWRWDGRLAELSAIQGRAVDNWLGAGQRIQVTPTGVVLRASGTRGDGQSEARWLSGAYEGPVTGGDKLRLNGAYQLTPYSVEVSDFFPATGLVEHEYDEVRSRKAEVGGRYARPLSPALSSEFVVFHQRKRQATEARFDTGPLTREFALGQHTSETVAEAALRRAPQAGFGWEIGGEFASNRLTSRTTFAQNGVTIPVPAANVVVREQRGEVRAIGSWRLSEALSGETSLRVEHSTISADGDASVRRELTYWKPRATATWSPNAANQVRLRFERDVGQLNFDDFVAASSLVNTGTVIAGNPSLTPQRAWVFEGAYERRFLGRGAAVLTVRHLEIDNAIDRVVVVGRGGVVADAPGNVGSARRDELVANVTLPLDAVSIPRAQLKLQLTARRSRVRDPVTSDTRALSSIRPLEWEAHFVQDLPQWRLNWGVDASGAYRETVYRLAETETRKFGTWVVLFGEYQAAPDTTVRLELQNLTSRGYKRIREVYAGRRTSGDPSYTDARELSIGPIVYLRLRRKFG